MDPQYLDNLKSLNMRPNKIKVKENHGGQEQILMEKKESEVVLREIFVQSAEIAAMPAGKLRDMQILRLGIIAEMDASNLYEKLAGLASNPDVKKLMLDISEEEKVHSGEFQYLLEKVDPEYEPAEDDGEKEVKDLLK